MPDELRLLRLALLIIASGCYVSFTWAVLRLFRRSGPMPAVVRTVSVFGTAFTVLHFYALGTRTLDLRWGIAGFALYAATLGLFWWAVPYARSAQLALAFTDGRSSKLLDRGPYRWVRHPFYASYTLFWISGVVAVTWAPLISSVLVMLIFYTIAIRREEKQLAARGDLPGYSQYRATVGCLLPRWPR